MAPINPQARVCRVAELVRKDIEVVYDLGLSPHPPLSLRPETGEGGRGGRGRAYLMRLLPLSIGFGGRLLQQRRLNERVNLIRDEQARIGLSPQKSFALDGKFAVPALHAQPPRRAGGMGLRIINTLRRFDLQLALAVLQEGLQLQLLHQIAPRGQRLSFGAFEEEFHLRLMWRLIRLGSLKILHLDRRLLGVTKANQ